MPVTMPQDVQASVFGDFLGIVIWLYLQRPMQFVLAAAYASNFIEIRALPADVRCHKAPASRARCTLRGSERSTLVQRALSERERYVEQACAIAIDRRIAAGVVVLIPRGHEERSTQ